jgi:hypothetical protein
VAWFAIDVRHMTVEAIERILVDVLEHADPSLAKQAMALVSVLKYPPLPVVLHMSSETSF